MFTHDLWICQNCRHMIGDPDSWPYTDEFKYLYEDYFNEFRDYGSHSKQSFAARCVYLRKMRAVNERKKSPLVMPPFAERKMNLPDLGALVDKAFEQLRSLFLLQPLEMSRLAYSNRFDDIHRVIQSRFTLTKREVWVMLLHLQKTRRLLSRSKVAKENRKKEGGFFAT